MANTYGIQQLSTPVGEPVSVGDMQAHSRIFADDSDNGLISSYITAAREFVETVTGRQILLSQYLLTLDSFPGRNIDEYRPAGWRYGVLRMPKAPLVSVDQIQYIDTNGTLQLLAANQYQVNTRKEPGLIAPARLLVWPITDPFSFEAVQVTFTCGWATAALVPGRIKQAIKLLTAHLYENREPVQPVAANAIPFGLMQFIRACGYGEYR